MNSVTVCSLAAEDGYFSGLSLYKRTVGPHIIVATIAVNNKYCCTCWCPKAVSFLSLSNTKNDPNMNPIMHPSGLASAPTVVAFVLYIFKLRVKQII